MVEFILKLDMVSKIIVGILFIMSILCWSVAIYRSLIIKSRLKQIKKALNLLNNITNTQDLINQTLSIKNSFIGKIITSYVLDFQDFSKFNKANDFNINTTSKTNNLSWQMLESSMAQKLNSILVQQELSCSILSISAQVAPLLGLLGTIWGLIYAFLSIETIKSNNIAGIAEALVTTFAGLLVAIPALVLFNRLQKKFSLLEQGLIDLTDKYYWKLRIININKQEAEEDIIKSNFSYQPKNEIYKEF